MYLKIKFSPCRFFAACHGYFNIFEKLNNLQKGDCYERDVTAVYKDKDTGQLNLWFKGQDVDRIQTAIENCIAARGKERTTSLLQELSERAMQRTKELNQHRPPPAQERGERL